MAERYPYPSDLDSDDEGSVEYDWDDDDQIDDNSIDNSASLARSVGAISLQASMTPPPRYPPSPRPPQNRATPLCIVCHAKPPHSRNGKTYPTCGLTCAGKLQSAPASGSRLPAQASPRYRRQLNTSASSSRNNLTRPAQLCVICKQKSSCGDYLTCGFTCAEKLCKEGGEPTMCNYCHRAPRLSGQLQCGQVCADKAKVACLLCKCRPRNGRYHLCGKTCKRISTKSTPLILEAPRGHATFDMVEKKFKNGWKAGSAPMPAIKKVFKIIENEEFLRPYNTYRKTWKNEHFRYHGTGRQCQLGVSTTDLCTSATCPVCNILKTSFKVSIAKASGAFGPGVYSSSAANKAFSYCGANGTMLLTKVVLGKVRYVNGWNEVMSCPPGFNSVVFDRQGGNLNETIVYSDDAIRPVFIIMF